MWRVRAVTVTATGHQTATADTAGGSGGIIAMSIMVPTALVGGGVTANFDGTLTHADHLTVTASSSNKADAHVFVVSVSIAAGLTGATADAEILSSAVTNAKIGPDAHVSVTNGITVDAHLFGDNNLATAKASGGGGGALVGAAVFKADAEVNGKTVAEVDGAVTGANALTVTANGTNTATADANAVGIGGLVAATLASSVAHIGTDALVKAFVGSAAVIGGTGLTQVLATGTNVATSTSNAGGGGFGLSLTATLPLAKIEGGVTAEFDGTINGGTGLSVIADGTNTATAHAFAVSFGFFAGTGSSSTAVITGAASVLALVGSTAHVNVPGRAVIVTATGHQTATADTAGGSGGAISFAVMIPTAVVGGGVTANFDGTLVSADHLTVTASSSNKADAHTFVVSVSILAGIGGATADAEILSSAVTNAKIGPDAHVSVTNGITVDAHTFGDNNLATATADGGAGGGLVGAAVFKADAEVNGQHGGRGRWRGHRGERLDRDRDRHEHGDRRPRTRSASAAWSPITLASSVAHIGTDALVKAFVGLWRGDRWFRPDPGAGDGDEHRDGDLERGRRRLRARDQRDVAVGEDRGWRDGRVRRHDQRRHRPDGDRRRHEHRDRARARDLFGFFAGTGTSSTAWITDAASVIGPDRFDRAHQRARQDGRRHRDGPPDGHGRHRRRLGRWHLDLDHGPDRRRERRRPCALRRHAHRGQRARCHRRRHGYQRRPRCMQSASDSSAA